MEIIGTLTGIGTLVGTLSGNGTMSGSMSVPIERQTNPYEGEYEITPTNATQTIEIANLRATQNITIKAIPENYGLITWNGSSLTVS